MSKNRIKFFCARVVKIFNFKIFNFVCVAVLCCFSHFTKASVFDLPAFLNPGQFSLGLEPEIVTSSPGGVGLNFKPKLGSSPFLNWQGIIGTGSGARGARYGVTADFDWFPDIEGGQPGIATPVTVLYQRIEGGGAFQYYVSPLIYKSFYSGQARYRYTPFVSVPFGWIFRDNKNSNFNQLALGSMFESDGAKNFRFTLEVGFPLTRSYSYISGGVTWILGSSSNAKDSRASQEE
jgi:hypothetical protein